MTQEARAKEAEEQKAKRKQEKSVAEKFATHKARETAALRLGMERI